MRVFGVISLLLGLLSLWASAMWSTLVNTAEGATLNVFGLILMAFGIYLLVSKKYRGKKDKPNKK